MTIFAGSPTASFPPTLQIQSRAINVRHLRGEDFAFHFLQAKGWGKMEPGVLTEANHIIGAIGKIIEICGIITILLGGIFATYRFFREMHVETPPKAYENYRSALGRAILLGLEFLVGGDIIGTVAVEPTFQSLGVLSLIVIIRTFLSFSLEVEIKGHWPWQGEKRESVNDTELRERRVNA